MYSFAHCPNTFRLPKKGTKLPELGGWEGGNLGNAERKHFLWEVVPNFSIYSIVLFTTMTFIVLSYLLETLLEIFSDFCRGECLQ